MIFLDIFPLFKNPLLFESLITRLVHHATSHTLGLSENKKIDTIVGLDARGFLLGPIIALRLGAAFVPVRKKGKLPGNCVSATYEKEYGPVSENSCKCRNASCSKRRFRTYLRFRQMLSCLDRMSWLLTIF